MPIMNDEVQVLSRTQACLLDGGSSAGYQKVIDLARQVANLDMTGLEGELINARGQAVCAQMGVAILLSEMKSRWDTRNRAGCEDFRTFFCRYVSFSDYCKQVWGYAETRCKQFVRIGRTIIELTHQAHSETRAFILPASVTEAINLTRLPKDSRLDTWQAFKDDGVPLPLSPSPVSRVLDEQLSPTDQYEDLDLVNSVNLRNVQIIRDIVDALPGKNSAAVIASLITPWNQQDIMDYLNKRPAKADLATMGIRAKHDLANTFHLADFQGLIGHDLDDFLIEKLNLI
jgi:hypothetical protein